MAIHIGKFRISEKDATDIGIVLFVGLFLIYLGLLLPLLAVTAGCYLPYRVAKVAVTSLNHRYQAQKISNGVYWFFLVAGAVLLVVISVTSFMAGLGIAANLILNSSLVTWPWELVIFLSGCGWWLRQQAKWD